MEYIVTGKEMKSIDTYSIEIMGIPSVVLMERAALAVADSIVRENQLRKKTISIGIVVGMGNNGADGLAVARILKDYGFEQIQICAVGNRERATDEWETQYYIVEALGIPLWFYESDEYYFADRFEKCDIIIDGIFGIGLTRDVTGIYREVIEQINDTSAQVYAIDIPSGINVENGKIMGCAVKADITVTFGFAKLGSMLYPGAEYSGKVEVYSIGFPQKAVQMTNPSFVTYGLDDLEKLPKRPAYSNKGTFGKVLLVAGSVGMSGACYLAGSAAYRCGAGLVQVLTAEENRAVIQTQLPEAIVKTWKKDDFEEIAKDSCKWADVIAIGPGCGTSEEMEQLIVSVLKYSDENIPIVIDADGLNLLAKHPEWKKYNNGNWILTPHLGEMGRLLSKSVQEITKNLIMSARELAISYQVVAVCKDARTIVDSGRDSIYINKSGNQAMAKGGSGDVLTGIISGLLACGMKEQKRRKEKTLSVYMEEIARLGVFIHGLAGDIVREEKGAYSLFASDLVEALSKVFCKIEKR